MEKLFKLLVCILFIYSCNFQKSDLSNINPEVLDLLEKSIKKELPNKFKLFYFDGSCAFCLGKVYEVQGYDTHVDEKLPLFLIASTDDTLSFKYNIKDGKINAPLIILTDETLVSNMEFNELLVVTSDGLIVSKSMIK